MTTTPDSKPESTTIAYVRPAEAPRSAFNTITAMVAVAAFFVATLGLVAVTSSDSGTGKNAETAAAPVTVTLTEFKISPAAITLTKGGSLKVVNAGTQTHNLSIEGTASKTPDIAGGATATLDLSSLAAGSYKVLCVIPGHADAGMKATLTVAASGSGSGSTGEHDMAAGAAPDAAPDYKAMDERMAAGMKKGLETFTGGKATTGVGNQPMAPTTVEADGTKVFDLEASIIDWQVSPGKTVKAWAYNKQVPGPWVRTEPLDKVKVNVKNNLPVSTDIHWHGVSVPNAMDGVGYLTQDPIKPGTSFTYSWTNTNHAEYGMYHAHDMGQIAVLNGLFAVFQVGDVPLPRGKTINATTIPTDLKVTQELPMVLNDAGVIGLSLNGKSYPATAPVSAAPGDAILVTYLNEGLLSHPMHLHRLPQLVVAKDGFALEQPYYADTINIGPGERYSVLIRPTFDEIGVWAWHCHILNHAENDDGLFGMVTALIVADPNKK